MTVTAAQLEQAAASGPAPVFPLTDLGNAERLVAQHGRDLRHVAGVGWHAWTGTHWQRDDTGEPLRRSKQSAREILSEAAACADDALRRATVKWAAVSEAEPRLRAAVALAASEPSVVARATDLDADPYLLNVENGTLDLRSGGLRPHNRADLITQTSPVAYDLDAVCPRWLRFLGEIFRGDEDLVGFVQRFVGYCLTGDTGEEVLAVLHGFGCNGKSTLLAVLRQLLGDYAATAAFDTFMRARGDRGPRNDLARLRSARLVMAAESGEGRHLDEATVKEITGQDAIACRFLYGEHFEFVPRFKLLLVTNHRPRVDGSDAALWRRLRLIPFAESFEGREDRTLAAQLQAELPGILSWAAQGCLAWQREGLGQPEAVRSATSEYRQEEDTLGAFLAERCVLEGEIPPGELRAVYADYCREIGETPLAASTLGRELKKRGISRNKRAGTYKGIRLKGTPVPGTDGSFGNSLTRGHIVQSYRKWGSVPGTADLGAGNGDGLAAAATEREPGAREGSLADVLLGDEGRS